MSKKKLILIVLGLGGVAYLIMRRREKQSSTSPNEITDYGFGDALNEQFSNPDPGCPPGIVQGCSIQGATNYDPCVNWGSPSLCTYPPGEIAGCMTPESANYNPNATIHVASQCVNMMVGCKDPAACNYNSNVQFQQAGTCIYPAGVDGGVSNNCNYAGISGYSGQLSNYSPCITCEEYLDPSYTGPQ